MPDLSYITRRILDLNSFLNRFEDVAERANRNWGIQYEARCPAHDTNHRSLAIAYCHDGRYLIHCHAGCSPSDILAAVGLELKDLYPDGAIAQRIKPRQKPMKERVDDTVLEFAKDLREQGKKLSMEDKLRERQAWFAKKKRGEF